MRVACVGAGPAGLYLALLLKRQEPAHEVTVYERRARGVTHGWGVVLWPELVAQLHASDPESARQLEREAFPWSGQLVVRGEEPPLRLAGRGYSILRQRLLEVLGARAGALGVRFEYGREVPDAAALAGVDLLVACDGAGSALRRQHAAALGTRVEQGRNVYAWLATSREFPAFTFGFVPTPAGWVWFHGYAFEPGRSTLVVECAARTWKGLGLDGLGMQEGLALLERLFARHLEGHPLLPPPGAQGQLPWLHFRRVTNARWHLGRLVLAGDAAHTTHFSIGSGTRLAMEDAIGLASALRGCGGEAAALDAALERYGRERRAALRPVQRDARLSAAWLEQVPRYAHLPLEAFGTLLLRRRSPLLPWLPPRAYCALYRGAQAPALAPLRGALRGVRQRLRGGPPPLRPVRGGG